MNANLDLPAAATGSSLAKDSEPYKIRTHKIARMKVAVNRGLGTNTRESAGCDRVMK